MLTSAMSHPSSVGLPRVESNGRAVRVLRLRGDARLMSLLELGGQGAPARLRVPSRETVQTTEAVRVEISFGPLADEVELTGEVSSVEPGLNGAPPTVVITLRASEDDRVQYVHEVLTGTRSANARSHRRVPVDYEARWRWGQAQYASRIRDLSRGGAFIASRALPDVGSHVDVEIRPNDLDGPLQFDAVVSWVRKDGAHTGFGVHFKMRDRAAAARLGRMVREQERRARAVTRPHLPPFPGKHR